MNTRWIAVAVGTFALFLVLIGLEVGFGMRTEIRVTLSDFSIQVSKSLIGKGETVKLVIRNEGQLTHELELDGYGVEAEDILPGQERIVMFKANKTGTFDLTCHLEGHFERGMWTQLQVQ